MHPSDREIKSTINALLKRRAENASICPSEVARALAPERVWRDLMDDVRRVAAAEQADGRLEVQQGGEPVDPATARGPIRLARPTPH